MGEEAYVYTACPGWGDHEYCALKTIVKDGRIVRTEHAEYTGPECNEGYICQKGVAAARQPYNADRVPGPLKRVGERGEGKWEQISWDQALDEIAGKMIDIREKHGPEAVCFWNLPASVPPTYGMHNLMHNRFLNIWGGTDPVYQYGIDDGPVYASFYTFGDMPGLYMLTSPFNFDDSKHIIVWGANPVENQQRVVNHLVEARSRGAKIVDVGLIFDGTAAFADQFVAVKPGSDAALALGMARYIVEEGWLNVDYLKSETTVAFLVRTDNGMFYRTAEGARCVWNADAGAAEPTTDGVKDLPCENAAIEGCFEIDGVEVKPVFQLLREHLATFNPDRVEAITGVRDEIVRQMAEEYSHNGPSYIIGALGLRYANAGESYRCLFLLGLLTGQMGYPGAGVTTALMTTEYPAMLNDDIIKNPDPTRFHGHQLKLVEWQDGVQEGRFKALIKTSGNPVHNAPNRGLWVDKLIPNLELIVDFDIWLTDTGEYADYVLPDCMPFEREEIIMSACYGHIVLQEPAIEPVADAHDAAYFFSGLAKRVGLGEYFDKTTEEWLALRLETDYPPIAMIQPKLTMERLHDEKLVRMMIPDVPKFDPFTNPPATPSVRAELYAETLNDLGFSLPGFRPPYEADGHRDAAYPFQFFTGRQRFFMQSMYTDDPLMIEMSGGHPTIRINPKDAESRDIVEGEKVEVYNQRGHMVAPARLDEAVPMGTIQAWFGWRHKHYEDGMYSEMLLPLSGHEATTDDPLAMRWWDDYVNHVPEGTPGGLHLATGVWDTIWDCACNIRKVSEREEA